MIFYIFFPFNKRVGIIISLLKLVYCLKQISCEPCGPWIVSSRNIILVYLLDYLHTDEENSQSLQDTNSSRFQMVPHRRRSLNLMPDFELEKEKSYIQVILQNLESGIRELDVKLALVYLHSYGKLSTRI